MLAFYTFSIWDLLMIPGLLLGLYAQFKLRSVYGRYLEVGAESRLSGADAARRILDSSGLRQMPIHETPGQLSDHYDPIKKALFLSSDNFHGRSLSALGVAAHEAGHALQHKAAYAPLNLRMAMVPVVNIASTGAMTAFFIGMLLMSMQAVSPKMGSTIMGIGIGLFAIMTFFQLVTLPVEFDASRRAKVELLRLGLISQRESGAVTKVLGAAAMTYVAAMVASALELLRLVMIARGMSRDDRA
ncbi:MAG: zinc metallopeptidase [Verrucomicrobia bacterium]|nr:zinc metallopeptidase [Verrucomicrobiota bacterium]